MIERVSLSLSFSRELFQNGCNIYVTSLNRIETRDAYLYPIIVITGRRYCFPHHRLGITFGAAEDAEKLKRFFLNSSKRSVVFRSAYQLHD